MSATARFVSFLRAFHDLALPLGFVFSLATIWEGARRAVSLVITLRCARDSPGLRLPSGFARQHSAVSRFAS